MYTRQWQQPAICLRQFFLLFVSIIQHWLLLPLLLWQSHTINVDIMHICIYGVCNYSSRAPFQHWTLNKIQAAYMHMKSRFFSVVVFLYWATEGEEETENDEEVSFQHETHTHTLYKIYTFYCVFWICVCIHKLERIQLQLGSNQPASMLICDRCPERRPASMHEMLEKPPFCDHNGAHISPLSVSVCHTYYKRCEYFCVHAPSGVHTSRKVMVQ